jgi:hypothetical protein
MLCDRHAVASSAPIQVGLQTRPGTPSTFAILGEELGEKVRPHRSKKMGA